MSSIRRFLLLLSFLTVPVGYTAAVPTADCSLDCTLRSGTDIFTTGQSIILDVTLRLPQPPAAPLTLHAALFDMSLPERTRLAEHNTQITSTLPISFVAPDKEGVFEIVLTVVVQEAKPARPLANMNLYRPATPEPRRVIETRRQFIVLAAQRLPRPSGDWTLVDKRTLSLVDSPTGETTFRRFSSSAFPKVAALPKISDLPRQITLPKLTTFGGRTSPNTYTENEPVIAAPRSIALPLSQRHFTEKSERCPDFSAIPPPGIDKYVDKNTWYSLPLDVETGKPYLVEIDCPVNIPQTFTLGIVDSPLNTRSNDDNDFFQGKVNTAVTIHVAEEIVQDTSSESVSTHRLLFWAAAEHSELVLINRQIDKEALFCNIRISRVATPDQQTDQRLPKLFEGTAQRKRIGQLLGADTFAPLIDKTCVPHISVDWMGVQSSSVVMTDYQKTYERCSRLLDTLCRGGYDGVTLTVCSKKSAVYPNETHHALEMMFRRFDNEGLTLIPAIEFDMPLPSLECLLQQHPSITEEILIGNSAPGIHSLDSLEDRRYNILHPAVQQAMAEMVLELLDRCHHHSSFGGIAIVLSPESYTQLPFAMYAPDDHTFAQFRQDNENILGIPFPDEQQLRQTLPIQQFLAQKTAGRIQFLQNDPKVWEAWVRWRGAKISKFYADLAQKISAKRADVPLYLLGGVMLDSPEIQQHCIPALPKKYTSLQAIQLLGFDLPLIAKTESLHFLKPVRISDKKNYCYEGLNSADVAPLFSQSDILPGVQFVHSSGDPLDGAVTGSLSTPSGIQSRKRFIRQLAQSDVLMFMDGSVALPLGQEPEMFDLLNTYRQLPPVTFQTFQPSGENPVTLQPLTIRYKNLPDGMIVYMANDAPFAVEADFTFLADARENVGMTELTGHRIIRSFNQNPQHAAGTPRLTWRASLLPYDLLAIRISDPKAKIESVVVHCPPTLCGAEGILKQKVEDFTQRIHAARSGVQWDKMLNADFELPGDAAGNIAGWECFGKSLTAQLDQTAVCKGKSSVKLTNSAAEQVGFYSDTLDIPLTGRLGISMFVGVPAECQSLPLSVAMAALYSNNEDRSKPFHKDVPVGETLMPLLANVEPKNGVRWHQVMLPFEHLPMDLKGVRVGVQYSGIGTVWIDDVKLYPVWFSTNEVVELQKMLIVADQRCSSGRVSDLIALLEDYWTQFLFQHVPAASLPPSPPPSPSVTASASKPVAPKKTDTPKSSSIYQRARSWMGL